MFDLKVTRRDFLIGASKIAVAAAVAPAIIKAENAMKIWVPPEKKIITNPFDANFIVEGLARGDQVFLQDTFTGEVLLNQQAHSYRMQWDIPEPVDGARPLRLAIRRHGMIEHVQAVGIHAGGRTKIKAIGFLKNRG